MELIEMTPELGIGFAGMLMVLIGFLMNQFHKWDADSLIYDAVNSLGGVCLVYYAIMIQSWPFLGLNGLWTLVSIRDVISDLKNKKPSPSPLKRKNGK